MANGYSYEDTPVLSKVKIGGVLYYLKDAEARDAIDSILNDYLTSADKTELAGLITDEETRAKAAEATLNSAVTLLQAEDVRLAGLIDTEATTRAAEDKKLQDKIDEIIAGLVKVKSGDKILALDSTSKELSTTLTINYDSDTRKLQLKGISGALVSEIDASAFVKDGMLYGETLIVATGTSQEVTIKGVTKTVTGLTAGHKYLVLCFSNGAATPEYSMEPIDVQELVDVYTAGDGLALNNFKFSVKVADSSEDFLVVDENGVSIEGVQDAIDLGVSDAEDYTDDAIAQEVADRNTAIAAETTRATGKEAELSEAIEDVAGDLTTEVARAKAAEGALDTRVTTAEGEIDALQADSHTHANKSELDLIASGDKAKWDKAVTDLASEITRATAAEAAAEQNAKDYADDQVSAEETRAKGVETTLAGRLDVVQGAATVEGSIKKAVADEAAARLAADTALGERIDSLSTDVDTRITAKINELDASANPAVVNSTAGTVAIHTVTETDGKISQGAAISGAEVYTKTKADSVIATAKSEAISSAKDYTDGQISTVNTKIAGLGTEEDGEHGHDVTASGTITPQLTKSDKHLGVSTTESDAFVKTVEKTTQGLAVAQYVNGVTTESKSVSNWTIEKDTTDAECLVFTPATVSWYGVQGGAAGVSKANAATGALSSDSTLAQVMTSIDASNTGKALGTVSLTNTGSTGIAFVESVAGATTTVEVEGTAANNGKHSHTITGKN